MYQYVEWLLSEKSGNEAVTGESDTGNELLPNAVYAIDRLQAVAKRTSGFLSQIWHRVHPIWFYIQAVENFLNILMFGL